MLRNMQNILYILVRIRFFKETFDCRNKFVLFAANGVPNCVVWNAKSRCKKLLAVLPAQILCNTLRPNKYAMAQRATHTHTHTHTFCLPVDKSSRHLSVCQSVGTRSCANSPEALKEWKWKRVKGFICQPAALFFFFNIYCSWYYSMYMCVSFSVSLSIFWMLFLSQRSSVFAFPSTRILIRLLIFLFPFHK